ncbi:MAG: N-6 DNA methylase [Kiritimatiellia bacterium]
MTTRNYDMSTLPKPSATKLRGGYYTPSSVAEWLTKWAIRSGSDCVLEPSCGDGVFLTAAVKAIKNKNSQQKKRPIQITAIEIIKEEADKARALAPEWATVINDDFFKWLDNHIKEPQFDVVLGNPPFIRYQNFPEPSRSIAMSILQAQGMRPNRLTNIWAPFVLGAMLTLREGGRLAMVIPAEVMQVAYAGQLRQRLVDSFRRITIYACNEMFFENAEQEVVLLLAEGKIAPDPQNKCNITLVAKDSVNELLKTDPGNDKHRPKPKYVQHDTEKWLKYFLDADEIDFMRALRRHKDVTTLSEHGTVNVGVVTGNNGFFVLDQQQVDSFDVSAFVVPLIGRSAQLRGAVLRDQEMNVMAQEGKPVFLLHLASHSLSAFTPGLQRMIAEGEERGAHRGYKCSIRNPWYNVPAVWQPDCFLFRQIYDFPRVVLNEAEATSTDTIHRVRCQTSAAKLASNIYTHMTAASAEIEGRSYGGGVLELEPTEAEHLLVPRTLDGAMPVDEADQLIRNGRLTDVLEYNDTAVLRDSLGLSSSECLMLKQIWTKMRDRRISRCKTK